MNMIRSSKKLGSLSKALLTKYSYNNGGKVNKEERAKRILEDLRSTDIEASSIVSRDGILIYSDIPNELHPDTFAAMSATMLGAAEAAMDELKKGIPERVIVETKGERLIATGAGSKALLVAIASSSTNLDSILDKINNAAEKIEELF